MTKLEQAAQQALEALEIIVEIDQFQGGEWETAAHTTITALREALAEQAEQEPVAWLLVNEHGSERLEWEPVEDTSKWKSTPLYTAPVRTKDLTEDEIYKCYTSDAHENTPRSFARAVIAADREKNK